MFSKRFVLSLLSLFVLSVPIYLIDAIFRHNRNAAFPPLAAYFIFVICSSLLMAWIAGRLFRMHGFQRFSFDMGFWFLFSALLALPLGVASIITSGPDIFGNANQTQIRIIFSVGFYLLLIPILCLTEGIFSLLAFIRNRKA